MKLNKNRALFLGVFLFNCKTSRQKFSSLSIVFSLSVLSFYSVATEVNSINTDKYLLSSCNAFKTTTDNDKTLPCVMYIKGYFNGLLNAGNENVSKIDETMIKTSTLVERAYANRVGKSGQRKPLSHSCITVDELKVHIIERLSDTSATNLFSVNQLNSFLNKTLSTACSSDNKSN